MPIPFDCGVLKPAEARYSDHRFRRVSRDFDPYSLDYGEACELVSFVELTGVVPARWIFHGVPNWSVKTRELITQLKNENLVTEMVQANHNGLDVDDGLAMLQAMRDGGWKGGPVPIWVRRALFDLRDKGFRVRDIAEATGLSRGQVSRLFFRSRDPGFVEAEAVDHCVGYGMLGFG